MDEPRQQWRVIVIVGPTGSGKSKLAIELAREIDAEIVCVDSKQMFQGLDIGSAKTLPHEMNGIRHHLIDVFPCEALVSVKDFQTLALQTIFEILSRGKKVVIVGGTFYYIEFLLFPSRLLDSAPPQSLDLLQPTFLDHLSSEAAYKELERVDPVMARKLHPNDSRKIRRALEVYHQTGQPLSTRYAAHSSHVGHEPPRFPSLVFFLNVSPPVLDARLRTRIEHMVGCGLLLEVLDLHVRLLTCESHPHTLAYRSHWQHVASTVDDSTNPSASAFSSDDLDSDAAIRGGGLHESIGFQEFRPLLFRLPPECVSPVCLPVLNASLIESVRQSALVYCRAISGTGNAPHDARDHANDVHVPDVALVAEIEALMRACIDTLTANTRRYSRKQIRWLRTRFYPATDLLPVYSLPADNLQQWDVHVRLPAVELARTFLADLPLPSPPPSPCPLGPLPAPSSTRAWSDASSAESAESALASAAPAPPRSSLEAWSKFTCALCDGRVLNGAVEWAAHLTSKAHRAQRKKANRHRVACDARELASVERARDDRGQENAATVDVDVDEEDAFLGLCVDLGVNGA